MDQNAAVNVDVPSTRYLKAVHRRLGCVPFNRVALRIGWRDAVIQLDYDRADVIGELGPSLVQTDIARLW
jgi:hypothetical protein